MAYVLRMLLLGVLMGCSAVSDSGRETAAVLTMVGPAGETWTYVDQAGAFEQISDEPGGFTGQGLDVALDEHGGAWTLGEFALQVSRIATATIEGDLMGVGELIPPPMKKYSAWEWTRPFTGMCYEEDSPPDCERITGESELGESIIATPGAVWTAQGGRQKHDTRQNHSVLVRYSTTYPFTSCLIPLPGDNNEVIGLAYDSKRNRVWFAESEGDHLNGAGGYSTVGWVKATGFGTRCQGGLDFGGNPGLTDEENEAVRAAAQVTIDSMECRDWMGDGANCVHTVTTPETMPSGATHLAYDVAHDSLWVSNWYDRKLRRLNITTGSWATWDAPPAEMDMPIVWQIATTSTHVYYNEYEGNRILRFSKSTKTWSALEIPVGGEVETHTITLSGNRLWFTVANERGLGESMIGWVDLTAWSNGAPKGTLYNGWGPDHSFRGIDVRAGKIAVTDHLNGSTLVLNEW